MLVLDTRGTIFSCLIAFNRFVTCSCRLVYQCFGVVHFIDEGLMCVKICGLFLGLLLQVYPTICHPVSCVRNLEVDAFSSGVSEFVFLPGNL